MQISVVILGLNSKESLRHHILNFERQTLSHNEFEVIIVDNGGVDGTGQMVSEMYSKVSYRLKYLWIHPMPWGNPIARNNGVLITEGKYILFNDDDCFLAKDCLENHLRVHLSYLGKHISVMGRFGICSTSVYEELKQYVNKNSIDDSVFFRIEKYNDHGKIGSNNLEDNKFMPKNFSVLKSDAVSVGGFDERYAGNYGWDDVDFNRRLFNFGVIPVYSMECIGIHLQLNFCKYDRNPKINELLYKKIWNE